MINILLKIFSIYLLTLFILSCSSEQKTPKKVIESNVNHTFNVKEANTAIDAEIGIDLLKYKSKVDSIFPADSFYIYLCRDVYENNHSNIYDSLGSIETKDEGDSITYSEVNSITRKLLKGLGDNIDLTNCRKMKPRDYNCRKRMELHWTFYSTKGLWTLTTSEAKSLLNNYDSEFYDYQDLSYMCIVHHLLNSLSKIEP